VTDLADLIAKIRREPFSPDTANRVLHRVRSVRAKLRREIEAMLVRADSPQTFATGWRLYAQLDADIAELIAAIESGGTHWN
jgi:hypothetical protein